LNAGDSLQGVKALKSAFADLISVLKNKKEKIVKVQSFERKF
jgi:hypothetical protein